MLKTKFGRELKRLASRDHGTEEEFGRCVGWSQGRVSQIIGAPASTVSYATLETVVSGFPSVAVQETLYQAWRESHAPSPVSHGFSEEWGEEEALNYIASSPRLLERGLHRSVLKTLTAMWQSYSEDAGRYRLALATGEAIQDVWSCVSRHTLAIQVAKDMQALAYANNDRPWLLRSIWREGLAVRPLDSLAQTKTGSAYETAKEEVASWKPRSHEDKRRKSDLAGSLIRDRAALASTLFRHHLVGTDFVGSRLTSLQRSLEEPASRHHLVLGKEVEARLLADLGHTNDAFQAIEESQAQAEPGDMTARVKSDVTKVRVLILDEEYDTASSVLSKAVEIAEEGRMLPYYKKLTDFERQIVERPGSKHRRC